MSEHIEYISAAEFDRKVIQNPRPVIVDFYSEDCPPCAALAPVFERLAEKYGDRADFVKIFRQQNRELAESLEVRSSPTVLFFRGGREVGERFTGFIKKPELRKAIEELIGVTPETRTRHHEWCDLLVLGGGPAGLTAGLYAARAKLSTILLEENLPGGMAAMTFHIANYPGTGGPIQGKQLMERMVNQARSFGLRIDDLVEIAEVDLRNSTKRVLTEDAEYEAPALIIATGSEPRQLPAAGAAEFQGRGVHYCAICDGPMYQDRRIAVVGGGNSAVEEAVTLSQFASQVTVIHEFDHFQASPTAQDELFANPKIEVIWESHVQEVHGEDHVTGVTIRNLKSGELTELALDAIFVYIGLKPRTSLFAEQLTLEEGGFIPTDNDMGTRIPGVFAAGDVRAKSVRQVITAAADGAIAATSAEKYLASLGKIDRRGKEVRTQREARNRELVRV